jgi:hypothetical protein
MSKRDFQKLAKETGIQAPQVEYNKQSKEYIIRMTIPNPDRAGYINPIIGAYATIEDAQERITDDLRAFVQKYPSAQDKITIRYKTVTISEIDNQAMVMLLKRLIHSKGKLTITNEDRIIAQAIIEALPPDRASGDYQSVHPDQDKHPVEWSQPKAKQTPIWQHAVDCPYCGSHEIIETYSPRTPKHCSQDACAEEHIRNLARERKRRQREREKASRLDKEM